MRWSHAFPLLASATSVLAAINFHHFHPELAKRRVVADGFRSQKQSTKQKRQTSEQPLFLTDQSTRFAVNGTSLPLIDFDLGESYAGLLPIDNADPTNQLFFWFFPSTNPAAQENKEILIWLTGGPGCSSVGELLQENGPVLWVPGTFGPVENKWSWHHLTNVVWIDQPVGAGFSQGTPTARDEADVARQFLGFWRNFVDTFALQGFKVYVTGSSYSGMYVPYISSAMLDAAEDNSTAENSTSLAGMLVFDGLFSKNPLARDIPVATFVDQWRGILPFNDSFHSTIATTADQCGYTDYLTQFLTFPPSGPQPASLPGQRADDTPRPGCDLFFNVFLAASELNPCFSVYSIANGCPLRFDPLGFSEGTNFFPSSAGTIYLDRPDVKAAIHAPLNQTWEFCSSTPVFVNDTDASLLAGPGSQPVLPRVIEATQNVLLGHGARDFVLIADGTLLTIQNLTWGGRLGFQARPAAPLYVPYHDNGDPVNVAGAGVVGTAHTERGLTYFGIAPAGHFVAQDQPAVAFRSIEVLLGRVESFQSTVPFTVEEVATVQPNVALGNGTFVSLFVDAQVAAAEARGVELGRLGTGVGGSIGMPGSTAQTLGAAGVTAGAEGRACWGAKGLVSALGAVAAGAVVLL